jgi:signal transduction histidine kinase
VLLDVPLPAGSWQMAAEPLAGWQRATPFVSAEFLLGSLLSVVLAGLVFHALHVGQALDQEVRERIHTEASLRQANRALQLLLRANSAVVRATDEQALLEDICRVAVDVAGYPLAWVGRAEHDERSTVTTVAAAGATEGFLDQISVRWNDEPEGRGTVGNAIRTRRAAIARDLATNPDFAPWRNALEGRNFATAIGVPIMEDENVYGALVVYATEADAFDTTEVGLLEDLGRNISHGMAAIRARAERAVAIQALEAGRAELEDRVAERTSELVAARDVALSADRAKSAFLANMSHELRTPLNSIIGFTGILLQGLAGPLNGEQRKQLTMVQSSGRHLLALISDVLDLSKIEAGRLKVARDPFDLAAAIDHVVHAIRPQAERKGLSLTLDVADGLRTMTGDRRRVEQVLMNLLSNAVKFTDAGGVTVRARAADGRACVDVSDTGIGIDPANYDRLFRPFSQIDAGLARKHEGTGLGLSICRHLMDLMGGTISVGSRPGIGSTFSLTIPLAPSGAAAATDAS